MPTKIKHYYRDGYRPALDPQVVGDELQRIEEKYNGEDPHHIVKEAESKKSPIHNAFEWDNTVAGHSWRLQQARLLIRAVVHDREDPKTGKMLRAVPSYVNVKTEEGSRYVSIAKVLSNDELRNQVYDRAKDELKQWMIRYQDYKQFLGVFKAAEKIDSDFFSYLQDGHFDGQDDHPSA